MNRTTGLDRNRQEKRNSEKAVLAFKRGFPRVLLGICSGRQEILDNDDDDDKTYACEAGHDFSLPQPFSEGNIPFSKENTLFAVKHSFHPKVDRALVLLSVGFEV